jgi:hypothetical protein
MGMGLDLPIGGAMEAAGLRYAGDERGGRREERERCPRNSPLSSAAASIEGVEQREDGSRGRRVTFPANSDPMGSETRPSYDGIREALQGIRAEFRALIPCHSKRGNSGLNSRIPDSKPNCIHPNEV